jgi:hypothetical protein
VPSQIGITSEDLLDGGSVKEIVIEFATFGAELNALLGRMSKIKIALVAVVEENSVGDVLLQTDVERNGLINRIFSFSVARCV